MDNFHFSTAECFENCPARFGFRYRQNIEVLPTDDPANPLILDVLGDIILSTASQQYGGFTVPEVDKILSPYAVKSFKKYVDEYYQMISAYSELDSDDVSKNANTYAMQKVK